MRSSIAENTVFKGVKYTNLTKKQKGESIILISVLST